MKASYLIYIPLSLNNIDLVSNQIGRAFELLTGTKKLSITDDLTSSKLAKLHLGIAPFSISTHLTP